MPGTIGPFHSVLSVSQRGAVALRNDVGLERAQARIVRAERLASDRVSMPVDHVAQPRNALQLALVFRVGLRIGVDRVRVAHVSADPNRASELIGLWNILLALLDELCGFNVGNLLLAQGQPLVHAALRTRAMMHYPPSVQF
jgi:hypothetical protein